LDFSKVNENHQFYYGIDGNFNDLNSTAFQETYASGDRVEGGLTRYPNDLGRSYSSGAYAQYYYLSDSWYKINLGARYDYNQVDIRFARDNVFEWPDYFYEGISNRNHSLNGSIGFHVKLPAGFNMRTLLGTSFRAPNIDDIAKTRLNNDEISVPNDQLLPEKSISGELTLSYQKQGSQFSITGFYTQLQDAIIRENFTLPSGETIYVTNNDTFNIVANVNAENAFIQGVSVNIDQQIAKGLNVEASYNVLMGRVVNKGDVDDPLGHIPPNYGRFFMTYEKDRLQLQAGTRFNGFKPLDNYGGSVDNPEFATENGSESWYTLHATAAFEIHKSFTLQVGMDNILDQFYVPFASGVPGAGRHISITMRGQF
jgi:hemoglobin/transferrin/lactoferrin receptor protein